MAVLPLQPGAESDPFPGLGKALAGMVVSDLSMLPGVDLVERDRLDALLGEIALSSTAYLDPATAQRLGKGVGAELVLVGTYSVVRDRLLLDARVVEVQSGAVRGAAAAQAARRLR
jgi:TolB-like protein